MLDRSNNKARMHLVYVFFCIGLLFLITFAISAGFVVNELYFLKPVKDAPKVTITITEGTPAGQVVDMLHQAKLVSSPLLLSGYLRWRSLEGAIRTGKFELTRGTNLRELVRILSTDGVREKVITIPEGWTTRQIADYLRVPEISTSLEGYLFPDTYRVFDDATAEDIIRKMQDNFERKVGEIDYDTLILASIVEREVAGSEDRRKVADLFLRRLKIGMALQADSTVNYVTGKNTPALSAIDRNLDTAYNTYLHRGLPPTPISNPGLDSINAVRNPEPNPHWYFLTDTEGSVHYARTLEEHNQNKRRYLY